MPRTTSSPRTKATKKRSATTAAAEEAPQAAPQAASVEDPQAAPQASAVEDSQAAAVEDPQTASAVEDPQAAPQASSSSEDARLALKSAKEIGAIGESLAQQFLVRNGYAICEKNWTTPYGEADIIVEKDGIITMVEVKTRRKPHSNQEIFPELSVDLRKRKRYIDMAKHYQNLHPEVTSVRFDIVALCLFEDHLARLRHIKEAFEWDLV